MSPSETLPPDIQSELTRRHKRVIRLVEFILALIVFLPLLALVAHKHFRQEENEALDRSLRIIILILGLGSVFLRRLRFSPSRLEAAAVLKGVSGLLGTLASTAVEVASLGGAITLFGFIASVMTGNEFYSYGTAVVGLIVLLYGYPVKSSWERTVQRFGQFDEKSR